MKQSTNYILTGNIDLTGNETEPQSVFGKHLFRELLLLVISWRHRKSDPVLHWKLEVVNVLPKSGCHNTVCLLVVLLARKLTLLI